MKSKELRQALACAVKAAAEAGALMRKNFSSAKTVTFQHQHDIKLELDVRCQQAIERVLRTSFPGWPVLGEEGVSGDEEAERRWVVDPIDGTVNFAYGVPHSCVSIALQLRRNDAGSTSQTASGETHETVTGVVYDPFCRELWTAVRGEPARLNGKPIHVSRRSKLRETIISVGFSKYAHTLKSMLPVFNLLLYKVRKVRIMGAAALSMTYVASGRFDAYVETGIRLWDIAAGGLILECAGGEFWRRPAPGKHSYQIIANNGLLRQKLQALLPAGPALKSLKFSETATRARLRTGIARK
ncbi:MAG: inositol monophosphatase [Verrucomicrobia bacterium]|nr:inositol monophosphatase [Verrucomicrobiota bacterium]